jgi:hypothetical protein
MIRRSPPFYPLVAAAIVLSVFACRDVSEPTTSDVQPETAELQRLAQESSPDPMAVARAVPGFGGLFLDASGKPAVYLTDLRQRGAAERALTGFAQSEGLPAAQLQILKGDFDYLTLDGWHTRVTPEALAVPGTVFTDLDERSNRVRIGVENGTAEVGVQKVIARLGIPATAVIVERTAPIRLAATLRSRMRPVRGGLQINFTQFICTLGFNALKNGVSSFITNSHCTETQGGNQGTVYYQPLSTTANSLIGTEAADPSYFQGGVCPAGRRCRYSDAARARYNAGVSFNLARVARTTSRGALSGPLTISTANPFFTITAERANPVAGARANKIGRTTGWTFGQINATCATVNVSGSNITQLCQSIVSAGVGAGDSGSPVFSWSGTGGNITLLGILWGGSGDGTLFVFSPMSGIERSGELGALKTF